MARRNASDSEDSTPPRSRRSTKKKSSRSRRDASSDSDRSTGSGSSEEESRSKRKSKSKAKAGKKGSDEDGSDGEPDVLEDSIRQGLREKLLSNGGRRMRVLAAACRKTDDENDGFLSKSEFKSIASTIFTKTSKLGRDEVAWLTNNLKGRNPKHIMYEKIKDVLTDGEVLFDGDEDDGWKGYSTERWAVKSGSVGEWLQNAATPQDRKNFKDFMTMLDAFERERGIDARRKMERQGNAIVVRLGPMLNVALKFYVE
ncbi:hypothetical protein TeGR_g13149 [Tetraparma gracilis]|uniref:EF-hand domain-containing protein n=1 Tax=Tetraparma gracilis TaxID=2962635 RepID=A0ABQ6MQY6_9STRA|nr:hypothetical protein TeGR_g13149 [Tetraparma gracilis]